MSYPQGPRTRAVLDRMEDEPMPRARCSHLVENPGAHAVRVILARSPGKVRCALCVREVGMSYVYRASSDQQAREVFDHVAAMHDLLHCDSCCAQMNPLTGWTPVSRDLGAVTLQAWLCGACRDADERDALAAADYIPATATPNGS